MDIYIDIDLQNNQIKWDGEDNSKIYQMESVNREQQINNQILLDKQKPRNKNISTNSYYQNTTLTGQASKVYASLQKLLEQERDKLKQKAKKTDIIPKSKKDVSEVMQDGSFKDRANNIEESESKDDAMNSAPNINDRDLKYAKSKRAKKKYKKNLKYNDKYDEGVCLSMHQPWASLLVLGIKKVEGRSWGTKYRGRLWIASARREPTPLEIEEVENEYKIVYKHVIDIIPFPKDYPTCALLGCVDLVDCLTNDEYQEQFIKTGISNEGNRSNYCFVCENPRKLIMPGGISGEHKLWKMPKDRIKPMQSGLIPCDLSWENDNMSSQ